MKEQTIKLYKLVMHLTKKSITSNVYVFDAEKSDNVIRYTSSTRTKILSSDLNRIYNMESNIDSDNISIMVTLFTLDKDKIESHIDSILNISINNKLQKLISIISEASAHLTDEIETKYKEVGKYL